MKARIGVRDQTGRYLGTLPIVGGAIERMTVRYVVDDGGPWAPSIADPEPPSAMLEIAEFKVQKWQHPDPSAPVQLCVMVEDLPDAERITGFFPAQQS